MWNGAAPNLKATPATRNTVPISSRPVSPEAATAAFNAARSRVPVAPYSSDMPYSSRPDAREPSTKYFIAASEPSGLSRSMATSAYEHNASSSSPRYTITRLPAETSSIMPAVANIIRTAISPLYRPRSRMNGQTYTSDSAVTTQATTLSTSAMVSRTNMPPRTVPCPPTPQAISAATASSATMARALVTARCFSSTNRSSISNAKAAPTSTSSGSSGSSSAAVGMVGIIRRASSELACGELARQLRDGGFHQ